MIQIVEFIRNYKATEGYTGSYINNASRTRTFDKIKKVLNLSKNDFNTLFLKATTKVRCYKILSMILF